MPGILIGNAVIKSNAVIASKPLVVSAKITSDDLDQVVITFDQALDITSVPATTAFTLVGKTISNVAIAGTDVTLTVTVAYSYGDIVTVDYTKPALNRLKSDIDGSQVDSFVGQSVTVLPEYEIIQYTTGLTTPLSSGQITLLNTFVFSLKTGLSISRLDEKFDVMHVLAGETQESALRNLVKAAHVASPVGSPAFVALEGFTSAGNDSYVNMNYNPFTQGQRYTQNSASYGFYNRTDRSSSGGVVSMGVISTGVYSQLFAYSTFGYINNISASLAVAAPNSLGMAAMTRLDANEMSTHHNKIHATSGARPSSGVPNGNFYVGARNNNGTADAEDAIQISFDFAGSNLSDAQINILVDAFEAYMDANGKGVI